MNAFAAALNDLLVSTFNTILKLEEQSVQTMNGSHLTISELHMLEAIHREPEKGRTITDIAQDLSITLPTVTVAVSKLAQKGYVKKHKGREDGRTVHVMLTENGRRAEVSHRYFHRLMVQAITKDIPKEEREILLKGLANLKAFIQQQEQLILAQKENTPVQGDETH